MVHRILRAAAVALTLCAAAGVALLVITQLHAELAVLGFKGHYASVLTLLEMTIGLWSRLNIGFRLFTFVSLGHMQTMLRRLEKALQIPADLLIPEYELRFTGSRCMVDARGRS